MTPTAAIILAGMCLAPLAAVGVLIAAKRARKASDYRRAVDALKSLTVDRMGDAVTDAIIGRLEAGEHLSATEIEDMANRFGRLAHHAAREEARK